MDDLQEADFSDIWHRSDVPENEPKEARRQRQFVSKSEVLENELQEARFQRLLAPRPEMFENKSSDRGTIFSILSVWRLDFDRC